MIKIVHKGWFYATLILALVVASLAWEKHTTKQALKGIFHFSYEVTVKDAVTGEILNPIIEHPPISSTDLFAQTTGTNAYQEGHVRIFGIGYMPRKFIFGHLGYKPTELMIDSDSPFTDSIILRLDKLPEAK